MKSIKIGALSLASMIIVSSCASSYQAQSGVTGAIIGSRVGETVGFLSGRGHHRGHNAALGSLIGMGVGAVLGVGIASQTEKNESQRYDTRSQGVQNSTSDYGNQPAYQTGGGNDAATIDSYSSSGNISISSLTYMDADGDGYLAKGEICEVEGYITNTTDETLNDIVIYLMSDNERDYYISPSLTTTLQPGQRIRYRGRIICKKTKKRPAAQVTLCTQYQGTTTHSKYLSIKTKGRY